MESLARDLRRVVTGGVFAEDGVVRQYAYDFSRLAEHAPRIVVAPADARELAAVVRFAAPRGLTVTAQGSAHSQGGQSLSDGGILLDLHGFGEEPRVDPQAQTVDVGSGRVWRSVVAAALDHGLIPPVLTTNLHTTIGGTASVGGIGASSFRDGVQLDNHVAAEVVTGEGDIVACSDDENEELFHRVLGGLGQFGIITKVRHRLRRHKERMHRTAIEFATLERLLSVADDRIAVGEAEGLSGAATFRGGAWRYALITRREMDACDAGNRKTAAFADFALTPPLRMRERWCGDQGIAAPGIDLILPRDVAATFIEATLGALPARLRPCAEVVFLYLRRDRLTRPMFVTPANDSLVVLTFELIVPVGEVPQTLALLERAIEGGCAAGAKQYLAGWLHHSEAGWRAHYGDAWPDVQRAKRRLDPHAVFTSAGVRLAAREPSTPIQAIITKR